MPLSRLAVYTTAHGIDPVQDHLTQLETADISPEFVALELPDTNDIKEDINSFKQTLLRQSPATGLVWYLVEYLNKQAYKNTDNTADRSDAEYEAGRQYADQHNISHIAVDLDRTKVAERYATWPRRIRDNIVLLVGTTITALVWTIAVLFALGGVLLIINHGFTFQTLVGAALRIGVAAVLGYAGRLPAVYAIGKIGHWFRDSIRELRDKAMYDRIQESTSEQSADEGLLIVGASHLSGIQSLAKQDGIECWQIESPAISRYDGDLDEISPQEMSELTQS